MGASRSERLEPWRKMTSGIPYTAGVYCVWAGETPLYVGTSTELSRRLSNHPQKHRFLENGATHITFIATIPEGYSETGDDESIRRAIEARLIYTHKPRLNERQLAVVGGCEKWKIRERFLLRRVNFPASC